MLRRIVHLFCWLMLLALSACAGDSARAPGLDGDSAALQPPSSSRVLAPVADPAERPGLQSFPPFPSAGQHHTSAEFGLWQMGAAAAERSASTSLEGNDLILDATPAGVGAQWGLFHFQPPADWDLLNIELDVSLLEGPSAWCALSDFNSLRWQVEGPLTGAADFSLDNAVHRSADGSFYCVILAPRGSKVLVDRLTLNVFKPNQGQPVAVITPWEITGDAPLKVFFDAKHSTPGLDAEGGLVEYAWDWENDGIIDFVDSQSKAEKTYTDAGEFEVRLQVRDSTGATGEDVAPVLINSLPVAVLETAGSVPAGTETTLSAAASSDADGEIVNYRWDTDGDGSLDTDSGTVPEVQVSFPVGGELELMVRITDDFGSTASAAATLSVVGWSDKTTLESRNYCGQFSNLMMVDGQPAIAFHEATNHDVRFMRATDTSGTEWGTSLTVDSLGFAGVDLSMAIVNGNPALSYQEAFDGTLQYVRAADPAGSAWPSSQTIDADGYTGRTSSIAEIDGFPAIAYGRLGGSLLYIRALDAAGATWDTPRLLDLNGIFNVSTSLEFVDGIPSIAYTIDEDCRYIRASDSAGASWQAPMILDAGGSGEGGCSLEILDGIPCVALCRDLDLVFFRANNAQGTSWGAATLVDPAFGLGTDCCLRMVSGTPSISYYDKTSGDLRFATAQDASGTVWDLPEILDSDGNTGLWSSLMDRSGKPMISYFDAEEGDLRLLNFLP